MIKPINNNVLLKVKNNNNSLIFMPNEHNDFYMVVSQSDDIKIDLENKTVFVKDGLIKVEYDNAVYFLCSVDKILAVVED